MEYRTRMSLTEEFVTTVISEEDPDVDADDLDEEDELDDDDDEDDDDEDGE